MLLRGVVGNLMFSSNNMVYITGVVEGIWKFNSSPLQIGLPKKEQIVFQSSFSRRYVKLQGCIWLFTIIDEILSSNNGGCFLKPKCIYIYLAKWNNRSPT